MEILIKLTLSYLLMGGLTHIVYMHIIFVHIRITGQWVSNGDPDSEDSALRRVWDINGASTGHRHINHRHRVVDGDSDSEDSALLMHRDINRYIIGSWEYISTNVQNAYLVVWAAVRIGLFVAFLMVPSLETYFTKLISFYYTRSLNKPSNKIEWVRISFQISSNERKQPSKYVK